MKRIFNYLLVIVLMLTLNVALVSAGDSVNLTESGDTIGTVTITITTY